MKNMSAHSLFRLRNPLLMAALLTAYPALAQAAGAASIDFAAGRVTAISASGERPLTKGAEIGNGDTIRTADGRVLLGRDVQNLAGAMASLSPPRLRRARKSPRGRPRRPGSCWRSG